MARRLVTEERFEDLATNGLFCADCFEPQRVSTGGATCTNGHGGAEGISEAEVKKAKKASKKKSVEVISNELDTESKKADEEYRHKRSRERFDFEVANAAKESPIREDVKRVVDSIFIDDIAKVYRQLEDALELGDDHSDRGTLAKRLGNAASNMRKAHRILSTAKVEKEAWETRNGLIFGAMWLEATRALQEEKDSKQRNKQITDADVKHKAAAIFGDEWHVQETERRRVKETVDSLVNLVDSWTAHHRALEVLLGKSR